MSGEKPGYLHNFSGISMSDSASSIKDSFVKLLKSKGGLNYKI